MQVPPDTPRAVRAVCIITLVMAALWLLNGTVAIPLRFFLASALGAQDPSVAPFHFGWGPDGFSAYLDRMTATAALGLPVGVVALLLSRVRAGGRVSRHALLASLWLQGLVWVGGMVVYSLAWGGLCGWFQARAGGDLPPRIIVGMTEFGGYAGAAVMTVAVVVGCVVATRAVVRAPAEG
jgi:hypothetical protein